MSLGEAWLAGFFEGEGCVWGSVHTNGYPYAYPRAEITNTDLDRLEEAREVMGFGKIRSQVTPAGNKQVYTIRFDGHEQVQQLACSMWKWLGPRRKARFAEVLGAPQRAQRKRTVRVWHNETT